MFRLLPILLATTLAVHAPAVEQELAWATDYAKAIETAKKEKRVILADFTGSDWCGWCKKLKAEVFDTPEFATWASKNAVLLELDFPRGKEQSEELKKQNKELQQKFNIRGYPTIVFIDGEGKEVARTGYVKGGPAAWIKEADAAIKAGAAAKQTASLWTESWEEAVRRSESEKKPILADFTGSDWCGWCIKLDNEVFNKDDFKKWAEKNVVLLKLDFPRKKEQSAELKKQNQELQKKYAIAGYPTVLFLDHTGKKLAEAGYLEGGPAKWIENAESLLKK